MFALAILASLGRWLGPRPALAIYDETRTPLAAVAAPEGFALSFIHSINLSPVDEEFVIEGDELVLVKTLFEQLSTGMPSGDEDGFAIEDGKFVTRPGRRFREIQVRISPVPGHKLSVGGRIRPLTRWAPPGGLLILKAAR